MNSTEPTSNAATPPNPDWERAIHTGLDALQQLFTGLSRIADQFGGPEVVRTMEAAQWFGQVAATLERAGGRARAEATDLATEAGEVEFHLERLAAQVAGTRFAADEAALRGRLAAALQSLRERPDARVLASAAGYFRAAAATALPTVPVASGAAPTVGTA